MSDIGTFLGKVAGKVMNAANADKLMKCESCDEITKHTCISYSDVTRILNEPTTDAIQTLNDYNPFLPVSLGNPYACVKCKQIRYEGGVLSNEYNKKIKGLKL